MKFSADVWTETLEIDETGYVTKSKLVHIVLDGIHADSENEAITIAVQNVSRCIRNVNQILDINCQLVVDTGSQMLN